MRTWVRRIRAAIGMGLIWALGGACVGFGIELMHNIWPNPLGSLVDIWPAVLGYPAFLSGAVFSVVLGVAGRRRRFDELSLPRFAAWGALGGLLASSFPAAMVALVLAPPAIGVLRVTLGIAVPLTLGSAIAATGTLVLARMAEDRELLDEADAVGDVGLTRDEARDLLGDGR